MSYTQKKVFEVILPSVFHCSTLKLLLQENASKFTLHIPLRSEVSKMCQTNLRVVSVSLVSRFPASSAVPACSARTDTELFVNCRNPWVTSCHFQCHESRRPLPEGSRDGNAPEHPKNLFCTGHAVMTEGWSATTMAIS